MDTQSAVLVFAALAQETRLAAFRQLVEAGSTGMAAGALATAVGVPQNTLSFHLNALQQAGLITATRHSRHIFYAVDFAAVRGVLEFLTENCCRAEDRTCFEKDPQC
jgi:DNA-binding transcriptional ArsR family regulator